MVGAAMRTQFTRESLENFGPRRQSILVLFLFLVFSIGFTSGYLVADGSMIRTYNKSFDKYTVENGHFNIAMKPGSDFNKDN